MKRLQIRRSLLALSVSLLFLFNGCDKPQPDNPDTPTPTEAGVSGVFVLNEGVWQYNNSSITYYNFANGSKTGDIFLNQNGRSLGDTGNDLKRYGSKLYCVVNISETIEVMDKNAKSLKQIPVPGRQPRRIAFHQNFAYVSCFDGSVLQIDTASLEITATAQAGLNPDGLCVANGKLYVANSGGLNTPNYDNRISVFSLPALSRTKDIEVGTNPSKVQCDSQGDVYVLSNGNYGSIPPKFQRIDSQTDEVVQSFDFPASNLALHNDLCYLYHYDYATEEATFKVFNTITETIVNESFIADGTEITTPYCIAVNPNNGDVYITDAHNYTINGDVHCFDASGRKKFSFEAGINPSAIVFF